MCFKVPEGHHPRGTTLREALRGIGLSEGSAGVSERAPRGLSEGSVGFSEGSGGSDPVLVTLGNCWSVCHAYLEVSRIRVAGTPLGKGTKVRGSEIGPRLRGRT